MSCVQLACYVGSTLITTYVAIQLRSEAGRAHRELLKEVGGTIVSAT